MDEQPQPDVVDADMTVELETLDTEATRRTRISTKRPDPVVPNEEGPKKLRIWSKHSRPLWMTTETLSDQPEKRGEPRYIRDDARVRRQLEDVHRVDCRGVGSARIRPRDGVVK